MNEIKIVGSMTTLPKRIDKILPVINSILSQTRKLDILYLHIPEKTLKGESYIIPQALIDLELKTNSSTTNKDGNLGTNEIPFFPRFETKFVINRIEKDYGPITKLLPVLDIETDPETRIITFDDDMYMNKRVVKLLENGTIKYPNTAVGLSGGCVGNFPFLLQLVLNSNNDIECDWLQGTHGVCYKREYLNKDSIILAFQGEFHYLDNKHDDHKIGAYLSLKKVKKIKLKGNAFSLSEAMDFSSITSISNSKKFWWEILTMCGFFKYGKIYTHHHSWRDSIFFYFLFFIFCIICIFLINFYPSSFYKNIFVKIFLIILVYLLIKSVNCQRYLNKRRADCK
jgi:hypothetical protein